MKSHSLRDLQRVNQALALRSNHLFAEVILSLCQDHANLDYVRSIRENIKAYCSDRSPSAAIALLDLADSLSSAKYEDATQHYVANQFAALLKKYPFVIGKDFIDPEKRAFEKFERSETTCRRFNKLYSRDPSRKTKFAASDYVLEQMSNYISYVIGHEPNMQSIGSSCGFGPGASIGVNGNATHIQRKLCGVWSVSPGAIDYARHIFISHAQFRELLFPEHGGFLDGASTCVASFQERFMSRLSIVDHNNISFVPKTTKIFRSIAVEPSLNSYVQKGIDISMRSRLRDYANIDLTDQTQNSEMARLGSFDEEDSFTTIDLSSASDSISIELCRRVLPPSWFYLLDRIRSKSYSYHGTVKVYEKFCSMGNGFCFPLQTLLFASMCNAVGAGRSGIDFRVYGDDIVVRKEYAIGLISLLRQCGFKPNVDKTFICGPFRESCGKDYYKGVNVRPVYLDYNLDSCEALFKFYNSTKKTSALSALFFEKVRSYLLERIPLRWRFVRPSQGADDAAFEVDVGDQVFLTSPHVRFSQHTWSWCWKELDHRPVVDRKIYHRPEWHVTMLYAALVGLPAHGTFTLRRKTETKVRLMSYGVATSTWLPRLTV